jgi:double-stranded uracil-DNA glycosylase
VTGSVEGFPPIAGRGARILVLGTMPGVASLRAGEYYAHPRNAFWPIVAEALGFAADLPYDARVAEVVGHGVAVWDVLRSCTRDGSLDAAIEAGSEVPNDLVAFLAENPGIRRIVFNGAKAEALFDRHVAPALDGPIERVRLASTSPANASVPRAEKLRAWRAALTGTMPPEDR